MQECRTWVVRWPKAGSRGEREICEACGKRRSMGAGRSAVEPDGLCSRCTAAPTAWYRKEKTMQRSDSLQRMIFPHLLHTGITAFIPECQKSGGAGGTVSCRGYRGSAPNPCAAALSPQTSVALFAGAGGQLGVFRQAELSFFAVFSVPQRFYSSFRWVSFLF